MVGLERFELSTIALEERYSIQLNYKPKLAGNVRIELTLTVLETVVLPLNEFPIP